MENILNYLPEFLLWGSALYFWGATLVFIISLFVLDFKEDSWGALVAFIVFAAITQFFSNFDIFSIVSLKFVLIYLGIGLIHSLIRTYFYGRKELKYNGYRSDPSIEEIESNIKNQETSRKRGLKRKVFRWWFLFPISLLTWIFSDLLKDLYNFAYSKLEKVFLGAMNAGQKSVKNQENELN